MDVVDLKSREVFSHEGRGVAALVDEPNLKIRQVGLEPGKEVPVHMADAPVIASGGVTTLADLESLATTGVEGAIVGKAIYEGAIDLARVVEV